MPDVGEVRYKATVDNSGINSDINDTEKTFKKSAEKIEDASSSANKKVASDFEDSSKKSQSAWSTAGTKIAKGIGAAFAAISGAAVSGTTALAQVGLDFNSQMETFQTSFEVMTGDAQQAVAITEQLKDTAAKTPFGMTDLAETTQLLMNYGLTADDAMSRMEMLGDISQGSADKMQRIAMAYGQMSSAGKVQLEDIKQMIEAGFNPLTEISKTTGESMESLYKRISKGTISVDEITASMQRSTSEGGKYYQSMEKQSKTLAGQISTLKDNFSQFAGEVTSSVAPAIEDAMGSVNEIFEDATLKETLAGLFEGLSQIVTEALPPLIEMIGELLPSFLTITNEVLPVIVSLISELIPPIMSIVETILPILSELLAAIMPTLSEIVGSILPVLAQLLQALSPLFEVMNGLLSQVLGLFNSLLAPVLDFISQALSPLIEIVSRLISVAIQPLQIALEALGGVFSAVFTYISDVISSYVGMWIDVFGGIIDFIKNVFTGNWKGAWEAVRNIFKSIAEGLGNIFKAPINFIIDVINGFIKGLNMIKIPDWVPVVGGFGINIPLIPRLKKGLPFVPKDMFPAYLDYGERVLTREENAALTAVGGVEAIMQNAGNIAQSAVSSGYERIIHLDIPVVIDGREVARATAWWSGEQLEWEQM